DFHVQCSGSTTQTFHDLTTQGAGPITCFAANSTTQSICFDMDDSLVYSIDNPNPGPFNITYNALGDSFCLYADSAMVQGGTHCFRLWATEADDLLYRPWRNASHDHCVVFNKPPVLLGEPYSVTVDVTDLRRGLALLDLNYTDNFVFPNVEFFVS
ncbi:uncharacterized protein LOC110444879, partial [Mizuhopecten yessoensis]|uniref:uncharacterized protein LOC110444879 n=1 Tax=Mizuhopecten yessoensis TaxID=6573 RepID=UPI000B45EAD8